MFFDAIKIEHACQGDLDDPAYFQRIYDELVLSQRSSDDIPIDYPETFKHFLVNLPSAKHQGKIRRRLRKMARGCSPDCRMELEPLRWWDMRGERVLLSAIIRDGQRIPISFFWKRSSQIGTLTRCSTCRQKEHADVHRIPTSIAWLPHLDSADGYGVRIEAATYQAMKDAFEQWLITPFEHPTT